MKTLSVLILQMSWLHQVPTYVWLGVALLVVFVVMKQRSGFQSEFLDQGNVVRTQEKAKSSYDQSTNAVHIDGRFDAPPVQGMESPFRVNMFNSYIP
jgi:hypothetical protein